MPRTIKTGYRMQYVLFQVYLYFSYSWLSQDETNGLKIK